MTNNATHFRAMGDGAVLVELAGAGDALPLALALRASAPDGVLDVVPAEVSVLVRFDPARLGGAEVVRWARDVRPDPQAGAGAEPVEVEVRYDGEDLTEVGRLTGLDPAGVVAAHTQTEWLVAFSGFVPGFGYLRPVSGPGPRLEVPRRDEPRTRVPAGSVALAAGYSGVYPRVSPGGWQLIGRTDAVLWQADRDPPALLQPGARVRFRAVS